MTDTRTTETRPIIDQDTAYLLFNELARASRVIRRAANLSNRVALTRDFDGHADEIDAVLRRATGGAA